MKTLGLAVITKNEEQNIERCLQSVPFAQLSVVVDSLSTDRTVEIAKENGAKVILKKWEGYPKQKQFALDQLNTDWILVLDADEYLTLEAQVEIVKLIQNEKALDAYHLPRYEFFMGRILKKGKGIDYPLRLLKRGTGSYTDREVHEEIYINGSSGTLKNGMVHKSSPTVMARFEKIKRDMELEDQYMTGEDMNLTTLFLGPIRYFLSYFLKGQAWRDGIPGVVWLVLFTFQIFLKHAVQYEKNLAR